MSRGSQFRTFPSAGYSEYAEDRSPKDMQFPKIGTKIPWYTLPKPDIEYPEKPISLLLV